MSGRAYYNEIDPFAAAWLRELIADGLIAPGEVDNRSIEDVRPDELAGFTQCHFFAGIGVWSLALRQAGWPDDRPVWTGSCPCQPFSTAGQGGGFDDERHLWPAFHWHIHQCRPAIILGEQVASKGADPWIDLVQADVEALGYAFGCLPFPVAGVGAPHIRDRAYWVADAMRNGAEHRSGRGVGAEAAVDGGDRGLPRQRLRSGFEGAFGGVAHSNSQDESGRRICRSGESDSAGVRTSYERSEGLRPPSNLADACGARFSVRSIAEIGHGNLRREGSTSPESSIQGGMANADGGDASTWRQLSGRQQRQQWSDGRLSRIERSGPTNGLWRDADWLLCRDEKWRPVEPDTFPLADAGTFRNRVGLLRGAGNAITLGQAQEFVEAVMAWVDQRESLAA